MRKKNICSMLHAYFDGQLEEQDMQLLADHCQECDMCQQNLKELNLMSEYLKACHSANPSEQTFARVWEKVESHLVQEQLSLKEIARGFWEWAGPRVKVVLRPAGVVAFILFLVFVPILEKRTSQQAFAVEAEINKIETKASVIILKTKQRKWTIIWIMPMKSQGGSNEQ